MTTAKKTAVSPINDVIEDAIKHGDIVPPQATEKKLSNGKVVVGEVVTEDSESGDEKIVEIYGVKYSLEAMEEIKDSDAAPKNKHGFYFDSTDKTLYRLVPVDAKESILDKAKALVHNKKFYISAGATAAALVVGTVIITLAKKDKADDETETDTPNDHEVEETTSA